MRKLKGPLNETDTARYVEASIARERLTTTMQLQLRRLQAKYRYGARGGVDPETGAIQLADGTRPGTRVTDEERAALASAHDAAELATLEWQALLLQLRDDYAAPMTAFPDDDGDWVARDGTKLTNAAAAAAEAAAPAPPRGLLPNVGRGRRRRS